ncbi:hypothetical protein K466DRAFT_588271 [Polyporus arcularius HHB13444]|uniref:Uncharacterized protein n=1 Tax=Polyporus arcularius HHB13444 TaxID=1314778 RepID=A0A5C3P8J9_9APHY|nr:hypothetical protein K466DRAFT_588271 [Polyporus arcularius HHB13444]
MPRRRRRRRHTTEPRPIQVERKYCDALADEDDYYSELLCPKLIPANGPRFCPQHIRECADSYNIYKDASLRAEELQPCVYGFSRKHKRGGFQRLWEVDEAIEVTGEFIYWAELELDERKTHAYRFYAHGASMCLI